MKEMKKMKHLKTYRIFESEKGLTPEQESFLNKCTRGQWKYDPSTGLVDVDGNFDGSSERLKTLKGIRFGRVEGNFSCRNNRLETLAGAPKEVGGDFDCDENRLESLEGAPRKVGGVFRCSDNSLKSLAGAPQEVGGDFYCGNNRLETLEGAPHEVGGDFSCSFNSLETLEGAPQKVGGGFYCHNNRLETLEGAPREVGGDFDCDAFSLDKGKWNPAGWMEVLKGGSPDAQKLIVPFLAPEALNQGIQKNPEGMIMKLKPVWNDESFRETRDKLVWPKGYEQEADLLGDLDNVGF